MTSYVTFVLVLDLYQYLFLESEPLRLGVELRLCFEINCYNYEIVCVVVVKDCVRN